MKTVNIKIEFYSFWHAGSGLSGNTDSDAMVNKDRDQLPIIPGKTLKGLIREAAEKINKLNSNLVSDTFIKEVFGLRQGGKEGSNDLQEEAKCFFSSAQVSQKLQLGIDKKNISMLYHTVSSTAINEKGQAKNHSLRQREVCIPLDLFASIEHFPNKEGYDTQLQYCLDWVKQMGTNRNKGLGRCKMSIINN